MGGGGDRLGDLPDSLLLEEVLPRLGSRQVVQTSALSRRWRHLCRDVPCVDLDHREFESDDGWASFEAFADDVLLLRAESAATAPVDTFRLHLTANTDSRRCTIRSSVPSIWIRRGLERFSPSAVDIRSSFSAYITWPMDTASAARLTTLRLFRVILPDDFGQQIGEQCPAIEDLHLKDCRSCGLRGIASPTLRTLTVTGHHDSFSAGELVVAAPRLASLALHFRNDGVVVVDLERAAAHGGEALGSLAAASIRVVETTYRDNEPAKQRKRDFWSSIRCLLRRAPNLTNLHLQGFTTTAFLDEQFPDWPVFYSLRTLLLHSCEVGANLEALATILSNTPNLEKLGLHDCMVSVDLSSSKHHRSTLVCKKLRLVEIKGGDEFHLLRLLSEISAE